MVKCVVSGCPNRVVSVSVNRGLFKRPPKRFFNFPTDPARVKVWLAALRETDKQNLTEQHLICEDHFLPEDISPDGVNGDAIPIMPPCPDGPMGMISSWGAESSEEEDQWATGGACGGDDDDGSDFGEGGDDSSADAEPPAVDPPQQQPDVTKTSGTKTTGVTPHQSVELVHSVVHKQDVTPDVSVGALAQRFLELMLASPDSLLDIRLVTAGMQTARRRIYDITNVLEGISLIKKQSMHMFKWIGRCHISSFLQRDQQKFQGELDNLKLVEDTLDSLIKCCAQQLFDMTDNMENAASAYVTHEDIMGLQVFQDQTVIVVKAPEETRLEVPPPKEDSIQVHLKAGNGPIVALTSDIGSADKSGCFLTLEDSGITTTTLHTDDDKTK
uniref:transcription factor E2F6 n=1 Tax=Scatophagus argus TaxID=75038 RepID=UPI001ED7F37B|nr:transcription factor E2F6 [Scatophagus argus]